jgi:hypothetical protein
VLREGKGERRERERERERTEERKADAAIVFLANYERGIAYWALGTSIASEGMICARRRIAQAPKNDIFATCLHI